MEIPHGPAVGDEMSFESPFTPQDVLQGRTRAADFAVCSVISPHDRFDFSILNAGFKGRKIRLFHILRTDFRVELMPQCFRSRMHREMFGTGCCPHVLAIPLNTADKPDRQHRCQERVLAVGLMSPAPAGIPENIDIRRPERNSFINIPVSIRSLRVVFGPAFHGNHLADFLHKVRIAGSRKTDRLRKNGCRPGSRDAVQCFVPPVVSRNVQPFNRGSIVAQLRGFFFKCHFRDQFLGCRFCFCSVHFHSP